MVSNGSCFTFPLSTVFLALRRALPGAAAGRPRATRHLAGRALLAGVIGGVAPGAAWAMDPEKANETSRPASPSVAIDQGDGPGVTFLTPAELLSHYVSISAQPYLGGSTVDAAALADGSLAFGFNANTDAAAYRGIAIGADAAVANAAVNSDPGSGGVAVGAGARVTTGGVAIGPDAAVANDAAAGAVAVGAKSRAGLLGTSLGCNASADASATAAGEGASAATRAVAVGTSANAFGDSAVALGFNATARPAGSVALGADSVADEPNVVSVGSTTLQRRIHNVQAGTAGNDAVNLAQLQTRDQIINQTIDVINQAIDDLSDRAVVYDDATVRDHVTLTGPTGTRISNLADGVSFSDAATVGQLTGQTKYLSATPDSGPGGAIGADASGEGATAVGAVAQAVNTGTALGAMADAGASAVAVGHTATAVPTALALGAASHAAAAEGLAAGINALVTQAGGMALGAGTVANAEMSVALGAGAVAGDPNTVSVGSPDLRRQLVNVAPGTAADHAVVVAQLAETGLIDQAGNLEQAVTYDPLSSLERVTLAGVDGSVLTNLQDAALTEMSTDAVTGRQLDATNAQVNLNSALLDINTQTLAVQGDRLTALTQNVAVQGDTLNQQGVAIDIGRERLDDHDTNLGLLGQAVNEHTALLTIDNARLDGHDTDITVIEQTLDNAVYYDDGRASVTLGRVPAGTAPVAGDPVPASPPVRLSNVAPGQAPTDAVNVAQLADAGHLVGPDGAPLNPLTYDTGSASTRATLAGAGGTVLDNVAPATVSAQSAQAVTGAQLHAQQGQVVDLGDRITVLEINSSNATNALVAAHGDQQNEAAIVADGTRGVAIGANASAGATSAVGIGADVSATHENSVALGAGSATDRDNSVSVGNPDNQRTVANVAEGVLATDAANVGQTARVARVEASTALTQANAYTDQRFSALEGTVHDLDRSTRRGIAAAAALQQVAPYVPGKLAFNAGVAGYRGTGAVALSVSRWNARGSMNWNAGVASGGGNSTIVRAGLGFLLD